MNQGQGEHNHGGVALRAALLGTTFGVSICLATTTYAHSPQLPLYIAALCLFHVLEYWTTAVYNPKNVSVRSFLLSSNGIAYWAAQAFGVVEYLIVSYFWQRRTNLTYWCTFVGCLLVVAGQGMRSTAMIHAAQSFSHALAYSKKADHVLVTAGVYSCVALPFQAASHSNGYRFSRHPSYLGFFWFGIGTQVLLGNLVGCLIFIGILWKFFHERIRYVSLCFLSFSS